jgi:tetratricopeptide (TPR) repeat protein
VIDALARAAARNATQAEIAGLTQPYVDALNQQAKDKAYTTRLIGGFFKTILGDNRPRKDWASSFQFLIQIFQDQGRELQALRLRLDQPYGYPAEIKPLIAQAEQARKQGDLAEGKRLQHRITQLFEQHEANLEQQHNALQKAREDAPLATAQSYFLQANDAFSEFKHGEGAQWLERAFDRRKHRVSMQSLGWLVKAGEEWAIEANRAQAIKLYQRAHEVALAQQAAEPDSAQWQYAVGGTLSLIGDLQAQQGEREAALKSYTTDRDIMQTLAARDPSNTGWQRDLAVSWGHIGSLQAQQGEREAALKSYATARDIMQTLAARDPSNTQWQSDLAGSYFSMATLGDLAGSVAQRQAWLKQCQTIWLRLRERGLLSDVEKRGLAMVEAALAKLKGE